MGSGIKLLISNSLKALEQGMFQEFCLSFLPLFDKRYESLYRHGGTPDGKTRRGVPDLLLTNDVSTTQIAVECSVLKDYWKKSSDKDLESWKPCSDIAKCVTKLNDLEEIVLCSNQEIPTENANVQNEVMKFAKGKTTAKISIFSLEKFENELFTNQDKYKDVIKIYLPEVYQWLDTSKTLNTSDVVLESYKNLMLPLNIVEEITRNLTPEELRDKNAVEVVIEKGSSLISRFQRRHLPIEASIKRNYDIKYFDGTFIGRIISFVGIPKIGKTTLIAHICDELQQNESKEIVWFDSPISNKESQEFFSELTRILLGKLIGPEIGNDYSSGKFSRHNLVEALANSKKKKKGEYVLVIDDFQLLSKDLQKQLDDFMKILKSSQHISSVGFVLISNKSLTNLVKTLDTEYICPTWEEDEIADFLKLSQMTIPVPENTYCHLLTMKSGGHPLIALALLRNNHSLEELLNVNQNQYPELYDEELTQEVKELLFEDILSDHDLREFVLRLSVLIYRHDFSVLDFLSTKINPAIHMPTRMILERLKTTILEGDESTGYQIAFVFRALANTYVTTENAKNIIDKVSSYMLTPINGQIDALKAVQAIDYSILIKNYERAFLYATLLVSSSYEKETNYKNLEYILDQLFIVRSIDFPTDPKLKLMYTILLVGVALTYLKIEDQNNAVGTLHKILSNRIDILEVPRDYAPIELEEFYNFVFVQLIYNLTMMKKYSVGLKIVNDVDTALIFSSNSKQSIDPLEIINTMLVRAELSDFPQQFFARLVNIIDLKRHKKVLALLFSCFQTLGLKMSKFDRKKKENYIGAIEKDVNNKLWKLLIKLVDAQFEVETDNSLECIRKTDQIIVEFDKIVRDSKIIKSRLFSLKADAYLKCGDDANAEKNYNEAIQILYADKNLDRFSYAISNYNLGLSAKNNDVAFDAFSKASKYFEKLGYYNLKARADGERAVIHYQKKEYKETVKLIEDIVEKYYFESMPEYAPAATIGLALLTRLRHELSNNTLPGKEEEYPKPERKVFERIVDFAKPHPSINAAYYTISEIYRLIDDKKNQLRTLEESMKFLSRTSIDSKSAILVLDALIEIYMESDRFDDITANIRVFLENYPEFNNVGVETSSVRIILFKVDSLVNKFSLSDFTYQKLVNCVEDAVKGLNLENEEHALAEIYKRKAIINVTNTEKDYDGNMLRKAWEHSIDGKNYEVLLEVGQLIGFKYFNNIRSKKELGEIHLSIVLAICNSNEKPEKIKENLYIMGKNIFVMWSSMRYSTSKESDYPFIINLKSRACSMIENNTPEELCSPVMILNLLKICDVVENSEYQIAIEWGRSKIEARFDELPKTERDYLQDLIV